MLVSSNEQSPTSKAKKRLVFFLQNVKNRFFPSIPGERLDQVGTAHLKRIPSRTTSPCDPGRLRSRVQMAPAEKPQLLATRPGGSYFIRTPILDQTDNMQRGISDS